MNNNKSFIPSLPYQASTVLTCLLFYILLLNNAANIIPPNNELDSTEPNTSPSALIYQNRNFDILFKQINQEKKSNQYNTTQPTRFSKL